MSSSLEAEKETLGQKSKKKSVDKDFIGLNQSSNDQAHSRMNFEVDSHKYDAEIEERNYFLPSTLKSRVNVTRQEGDAGFASSGKQFNINSDAVAEKIVGGRVQSWTIIENKFTCGRESSNADGRVKMDDNAISFIPRSPMKQKVQIPEETNERRDEDMAVGPHARNYSSCFAQTSNAYPGFKKVEAPQSYLNDNNDSLSPVSVLEVTFSNDSNFSGSLDNTPVYLHPAGLMDCSNIKPQKLDPIFDSAIPLSKESDGLELVTDLLNHTCEMLHRIEIVGSRLEGTKLDHAKEVILNAELLFGSAAQHDSDKTKGFSLSYFLTHELEALASILRTSSSCLIGFENGKRNSLQEFLFDCIIEYIDSRYSPCFNYGSNISKNLASRMNAEKLIQEVDKEIRSWRCVAGLVPDKLIEREMSCCQQNSFEEEAYETSAEIAENMIQFLMNEIIKDLSQIKL